MIEDLFQKVLASAVTVTPSLEADKLTVLIQPSHGEPCEGSTSGGDDCPFASESYMINPDGQKSTWCASRLKLVLSMHDPSSCCISVEQRRKSRS